MLFWEKFVLHNMKERVAIVTGGTGALGRFIVMKLSDLGIKVYVPSRTIEEFNNVFDESQQNNSEEYKPRKIFSFVCDATEEKSVCGFVQNVAALENGKIDYLINTVGGIGPPKKVIDLSTAELDNIININFRSTFYFTIETLKRMAINHFGRIISIGAIAGLETSPERFAYSFSKAGVINLMDTISEEMKDMNIRCNTIIPSIIDTPSNREWGSSEDIKKWVRPEEVAEIILSLISENISSIRSSHLKIYGAY